MPDIKRQLDQIIFDKWSAGKKAELKPSELGWNQDTMPWKAEFKHNAADSRPFVYRAEGKYISFKPAGLSWVTPQGQTVIKQGVNPSVGNIAIGKVCYANALGAGVGLEASVSRTTWRELVTIESLSALGTIPTDAEFLEISLELETDFEIEGWDKKSELKFNKAIRLSELSQLESIKTWDSHIIPEPKEGEEPEDPFERCDGFLRGVEGRYYLVKRIPVEYLRQAVYPVTTDIEITYGSEYAFNSVLTSIMSCAALDATHFVVAYCDYGGDKYGIARIGVVSSGDEIAYGSEYTFNAAVTVGLHCAALDATHFVVIFLEDDVNYHGNAIIGVVSNGDEIAYGSKYEFNTKSNIISCAALDSTHFVVAYRDWGGDTHGHAKIGVVSSGDNIAYGSEYTFNAADTSVSYCAALDSTHFVVAYRDSGGDTHGHAKIGVVSSGDNIAYGSEYTFNAAVTNYISCAALDATHFVVGFRDDGDSNKGKAIVGIVSSGDNIAYGSEYTFNAAVTGYLSCAALDSTHFVVAYKDSGGDTHGHAKIGVVSSGDNIAYGSEYTFNAADTGYLSCAALDSTHFVVGFRDSGGDDFGIAMIGSIPEEYTPENKSANMGAKMVAAGLI